MNKMSESLQELTHQLHSEPEEFKDQSAASLQESAAEFAKVSINTFQGTLLEKALDVSKSIAEFTSELNRQ